MSFETFVIWFEIIIIIFNIQFTFYNQSSSKPLPGRGANEKIEPKEYVKEFSALHAIPDWRKKLDRSW